MTTPFVVGIAGGSGAGKTALGRALAVELGPESVARLAHDAYYHDGGRLEPTAPARLDFDVPQALDQRLFREHLEALRRGEPVVPPDYCFVTHRRRGHAEPVAPREVLLVDGILLLHDAAVRELLDLRIYVDAPADVRLSRRVARDCAERGRTPQAVLEQCQMSVFPAHARYVEPTRAYADLILVNTGRLEAVAEIGAGVIRARLRTRRALIQGAQAA